jgi:uncharacterized membrane protein YccC
LEIFDMAESQVIPWKRIAVEAAAIVGSILLAFAIDAWWDARNDYNALSENLLALEQEILQNLSDFDKVLGTADRNLKDLDEVFQIIADRDRPDLPAGFVRDVGQVYYYMVTDVSDSALGVVVRPNNLQRIKRIELRHHLVHSYEALADVAKYERRLENEFTDRQQPALARIFLFDEASWYVDDEPELQHYGLLHPVPESPFTSTSKAVKSKELWNLLYVWRGIYLDFAKHVLLAKEDHLLILNLLEKELEGRR